MFRRMFWFLTGAVTGVWATVKVNRAVRRLSPDSLAATAADRALETGARLRLFARDVRAGMAQREGELHDALGLKVHDQPPALPAAEEHPGLTARNTDVPAARRGITYNAYDRKDEH
ncbi:DUF6167 family protein [Actinacidiphila acidipaludis]|uniref:DUF6167 family protein n=1 Tax=Actinacidiphila acidipaludis TaxID=2873382 RepID=A0ABS7QDP7_9ACTN|nr:DUF6167 family protein [Streptomyces acidipaludis]MBY8879884.1 DUF6167 family protein [Streptomyces acidipaludis]